MSATEYINGQQFGDYLNSHHYDPKHVTLAHGRAGSSPRGDRDLKAPARPGTSVLRDRLLADPRSGVRSL
jgi:hypothetical protein